MPGKHNIGVQQEDGSFEYVEILGSRDDAEKHMFRLSESNESSVVQCEFDDAIVVMHNHGSHISKEVTTYFVIE